jgi:hypothetical protein
VTKGPSSRKGNERITHTHKLQTKHTSKEKSRKKRKKTGVFLFFVFRFFPPPLSDEMGSAHSVAYDAIESRSLPLLVSILSEPKFRTALVTPGPGGASPLHAAAACPDPRFLKEVLAKGAWGGTGESPPALLWEKFYY